MNPKLIGVAGPLRGNNLTIEESEVSIGRDPSNHLWVMDPALSRRQCQVVTRGETFFVHDLDSRNGTLVNGVPIKERELQHGDQILVGNSVLVFVTRDEDIARVENPVEVTDTAGPLTSAVRLRPEDGLYESDEKMQATPSSERLARDLNSLLRIAKGIGGIRDRDSLQWQLLGLLFDVVPAERAAILLFDRGEISDPHLAVAWDRARGPGHLVRVSRTIVQRVLEDGSGLLVSDVQQNDGLKVVKSISADKISSLLCVPLVISGSVFGVLYLDTSNPAERFDEHQLEVMTAVAGIAALALDNVRHLERLVDENRTLRSEIEIEHSMVGGGHRIREVFEFIRRVAPTESTVLIQGESGTGKELVARAMHRNSPRSEKPFVAINCAAITESLLESELFGHEKGAFTGAIAQKKGKLEMADGGTLFLDEVTELAPGLQAKLLRVLQEREFERVGGTRSLKADIRLIAATNREMREAVESGVFRQDLYYRLNVVAIHVPPLRERREDIPLLVDCFVGKTSRKCNTRVKPVAPETMACLTNYDWPGNVRELENAIERALVLGSGDSILPDDLPESIIESVPSAPDLAARYHGALKDTKRLLVLQALEQAGGNYIEGARILGLHPNSLLRLIRNLNLKAAVKNMAGA